MNGVPVGLPYRTAEAILWPPMVTLTRHRWAGQQHLGRHGRGVVLGVNHISWVDPLVIAYFLHESGRPPRFMAKQSLFEVPLLGKLVDSTGQIPVSRDVDPAAALGPAGDAVRAGECLVVYPEGTITRDPGLWPMKGRTGALRVALETGAPLIPVAQWGAQEIMAPYSKRIDVSGRKLLQVAAGPAVDIDDLRGVPLTREHLEEGTERLMAAITALLAGIRGEQAPPQRLDWSARRRGPAGVRNEEDRWLGLQ